jgi:hypothetical protein
VVKGVTETAAIEVVIEVAIETRKNQLVGSSGVCPEEQAWLYIWKMLVDFKRRHRH